MYVSPKPDSYGKSFEFCGLPGSGKTTISDLVVAKLKEQGIATVDRRGADRVVMHRYAGSRPAITLLKALGQLGTTPELMLVARRLSRTRAPIDLLRAMVRVQQQSRFLAESHQQDVLVLDEWLVHQLWLLRVQHTGVTDTDVLAIGSKLATRCIPPGWTLVNITITPAIAARRLLSRGNGNWFERLPLHALERTLHDGSELLQRCVSNFAKQAAARLMCFDATTTAPEDIAASITSQVVRHL